MKTFLAILGVAVLAVIVFFIGIQQKWWKNPFSAATNGTNGVGDNGNGTQTCADGSVIPITETCPRSSTFQGTPINLPSKKVDIGNITPAKYPPNLYPADYASRVVSTKINPSPFIHYETNFNTACHFAIWHNGGLYVKIKEATNASGVKSCFYEFKKAFLPSEIKIPNPNNNCTTYQYYLSGVLYVYDRVLTEQSQNPNAAPNYFCMYKKQ